MIVPYRIRCQVLGRRVTARLVWSANPWPNAHPYFRSPVGARLWRHRPVGLRRTARRGARWPHLEGETA